MFDGGPVSPPQALILAILAATIALFLWGRWRHDMVAVTALLACVVTGLLPGAQAFAGFGHPAIITVACVLVLSAGLQRSGAVDALIQRLLPSTGSVLGTTTILTAMAALLSAFMNNVGALALLMPVGMQLAQRYRLPPSKVLMPLSFASILGGMTTLIGTPPNLIVADFRAELGRGSFTMFDFSPVGVTVAIAGIAFVILVGWRLVPGRRRTGASGFEIEAYLTEAHVPDQSKAVGMLLREVENALAGADARIIGLVRGDMRIPAPNPFREVRPDDILLIQAEPETLASALSSLGLRLEEDVQTGRPQSSRALESREVTLSELVVLPNSELAGRTASDIRLRSRYGINLLGISRQGQRSFGRLRSTPIRTGDVLLMQGSRDALTEFGTHFGCVPLAERKLYLPHKRLAIIAIGIMVAAIIIAALGIVPTAIAFTAAVLLSVAFGVMTPRTIYSDIDWSIIVLLGALIPVAGVLADTGAADLIARFLLEFVARGQVVIALGVILIVSMTLSDFMNNAATAAVICPVAIQTAERLMVSPDPFLMAVAIGASCAFLTPIGHQNNTLILGPAGLRFGDYWRLGLPLEAIVVIIGIPMILLVWPF